MNIKQRALIHTVLVIVGTIALAIIFSYLISQMTPDQLGTVFMICMTALIAKIIYDYRLDQLTYEAKLAEMAEKTTK